MYCRDMVDGMTKYYRGDSAVYLRKDGNFEIRIPIATGTISKEQLTKVAEVTERCGKEVHLTVRQGIQILGVPERSLDEALSMLETVGLRPGSTGKRVRNILACPGDEYCFKATQDTRSIADSLAHAFAGRDMPAKFKIAISGCPFACTWPQMNDVGLLGRVIPVLDPGLCSGCGACEQVCIANAISLQEGRARIDDAACAKCGRCADACPHGAIVKGGTGFMVTVGGRGSYTPKEGYILYEMLPREEVLDVIERIMEAYSDAPKGMRLREFIDLIGHDEFERRVKDKDYTSHRD